MPAARKPAKTAPKGKTAGKRGPSGGAKRTARRKTVPRPKQLTVKQQLFIEAYLGKANGSATEAARLAGYRGTDVTLGAVGYENLRKPQIAKAVAERLEKAKKRLDADGVIELLIDHALGTVEDFLSGADFDTLDLRRAHKRGKLHLVKAITPTKYGRKLELHDAQSALEKLGRFYKLFTDRLETETRTQMVVRIPMKATPEEWEVAAAKAREHAEERAGSDGAEK